MKKHFAINHINFFTLLISAIFLMTIISCDKLDKCDNFVEGRLENLTGYDGCG